MGNTVCVKRAKRPINVYLAKRYFKDLTVNFEREHISTDVWRLLKKHFFSDDQIYAEIIFNFEKANVINDVKLLSMNQSQKVQKLTLNVSGAKGEELTKCQLFHKLHTVHTVTFDFNSIPMDNIESNTTKFLIRVLKEASNTTRLHLAMQKILADAEVFYAIFSQISTATSISELDLDVSGNNLLQGEVSPDQKPLRMIATHFSSLTNLNKLSLVIEENCVDSPSLEFFIKKIECPNLDLIFENTLMTAGNMTDDQFQSLCNVHCLSYQNNSSLNRKTISRKKLKNEKSFADIEEYKNDEDSARISTASSLNSLSKAVSKTDQGKPQAEDNPENVIGTVTVRLLTKLEGYDQNSVDQFAQGILNQLPDECPDFEVKWKTFGPSMDSL